jgi:hypothetical protein
MRNENNYEALNTILLERFSKLELIAVNKSFEDIIKLSNPEIDIDIPERLHDCLIVKENKWGCGVTKDGAQECCEKRLGSPIIKASWTDKDNNESIELHYNPTMGSSKILRKYKKDVIAVYYCNNLEPAIITCKFRLQGESHLP